MLTLVTPASVFMAFTPRVIPCAGDIFGPSDLVGSRIRRGDGTELPARPTHVRPKPGPPVERRRNEARRRLEITHNKDASWRQSLNSLLLVKVQNNTSDWRC
jgi:hypothetical protein